MSLILLVVCVVGLIWLAMKASDLFLVQEMLRKICENLDAKGYRWHITRAWNDWNPVRLIGGWPIDNGTDRVEVMVRIQFVKKNGEWVEEEYGKYRSQPR